LNLSPAIEDFYLNLSFVSLFPNKHQVKLLQILFESNNVLHKLGQAYQSTSHLNFPKSPLQLSTMFSKQFPGILSNHCLQNLIFQLKLCIFQLKQLSQQKLSVEISQGFAMNHVCVTVACAQSFYFPVLGLNPRQLFD
jgi:hypothetical protein